MEFVTYFTSFTIIVELRLDVVIVGYNNRCKAAFCRGTVVFQRMVGSNAEFRCFAEWDDHWVFALTLHLHVIADFGVKFVESKVFRAFVNNDKTRTFLHP